MRYHQSPTPTHRSYSRGQAMVAVLLVTLLIAGASYLWWQHYHRQQAVVATVGSHTITQHDLGIALRASLWRQSLQWQQLSSEQQQAERERVLQDSLNTYLLEAALLLQEVPIASVERDAEQRLQQSLKQFESSEAWLARAIPQQLDETTMRSLLQRETRLSHALEIWFKQQTTFADITAIEAEAKAWFDQHQAQFQVPESAHASHLFLTIHDKEKPNRESDIRAYHQRVVGGQNNLASLAKQFSDDPRTQKTEGDLGWFSRARVPPDFADRVFAMSPGQLSQPFLTKLGWHIVQLHEKRPARQATFAECRAEIIAVLQDRRRQLALGKLLSTQRESTSIEIHPERLQHLSPAS